MPAQNANLIAIIKIDNLNACFSTGIPYLTHDFFTYIHTN